MLSSDQPQTKMSTHHGIMTSLSLFYNYKVFIEYMLYRIRIYIYTVVILTIKTRLMYIYLFIACLRYAAKS